MLTSNLTGNMRVDRGDNPGDTYITLTYQDCYDPMDSIWNICGGYGGWAPTSWGTVRDPSSHSLWIAHIDEFRCLPNALRRDSFNFWRECCRKSRGQGAVDTG